MKKLSVALFSVFVFLVSSVMVSHAAIVAGTYSPTSDTFVSVQSLYGGNFGLGDISNSVSSDGFSTVVGGIRTVDDVSYAVVDERLVASRYNEREGAMIATDGQAFGVSGTTYTGSLFSTSSSISYYDWDIAAGPEGTGAWVLDVAIGTSTAFWTYDSEPQFTFLKTAQYTYDNSAFTDLEYGYRYLNLTQTNGVLTISAVPVPGTMILLGMGIVGLAGLKRRKQ